MRKTRSVVWFSPLDSTNDQSEKHDRRQVETDATGFERENHNWGPAKAAVSFLVFLLVPKNSILDAVVAPEA